MGSAQTQSELWSQAPEDWAALQEPLHAPLWEAMLAATGVGNGAKLLDAGCGAGGLSVLAAQRGAEVSGIDATEALVGIAQERVSDGEFRTGDLEALPYGNDTFDVVLAANSAQYAADPVAALAELKRVTKSGGRIVVAIWGQAENCEFRHILKAVAETMPEPPKGGGPFALSESGALEALLAKADITTDGRGEVACPFDYDDVASAWRATASSGPLRAAMRAAGEGPIREAVSKATQQFVRNGGEVHLDNTMIYVTATV
ncbi:MAG: class I SAM-dependent methyltransferase [Rhodospirillales bacterium]|nr:class I SAM-dependent methyltransferase [Rhodospirillales bacterium]